MAVEYFLSGWPLSSWISPGAAFFLFVNVLIGAIVVTSRRHHQGGRAAGASSTRRLCRSASSSMVLDRIRSFSMFSVHPAVPVEEYYSYSTSSPELELEVEAEELLEQPHQPAVAEPARSPVAAAAVGAAPVADGAPSEIAKEEAAAEAGQDLPTSSDDDQAAHGPARQQSPSLDVVTGDETTAAVESQRQEEKLAAETTMKRAPACRRETEEALLELEGKAALNARADSFIRRFREDLKLERLNSIINYTRTLRRGASAAASPTAQ